jgi:peroxiredoxin Q/BCP
MVEVGENAPDFCLQDGDEKEICLESYQGKWIVLYFYPKDNTSGCTREAMYFTVALQDLQSLGAEVLGVSRDLPASHREFANKHGLRVKLASDQDHKVMEAYGAWALKKIYGKESFGVVRSTFLINPHGIIAHIWRKVAVKGHVNSVIKTLQDLNSKSDG